jgi:prepilin-type processing-associated H-X9-DG protein
LVEILVVAATLIIAVAVLVPALGRKVDRGAVCLNNLKQIGVAFTEWSHDHESGFPWTVGERQGGTLEYAGGSEVFRHFQTISNELGSPKILICPDDSRSHAKNFSSLANANLSYFIGLDADAPGPAKPASILSGDRTLATNRFSAPGVLTLPTAKALRWTMGSHEDTGNILWADGSVATFDQLELRKTLQERSAFPTRLQIP